MPYTLRLSVPLDRSTTWQRLWSPARHTAAIPLTRVRTDPAGPSMAVPGTAIRARTALGPVGVDDLMLVTAVETPDDGAWRCRVVKTGRWVHGEIDAQVTAAPSGGSDLVWRQRISVTGLPRALSPVVSTVARSAYRAALLRILDPGPASAQ